VRAGRLDRRITIQRRTETTNPSNNESIFNWVDVVTCWAEFESNRGQEFFSANQKQAETVGLFRMRYFPGIVAEMRIIFDGSYFDITAVNPMRGRNTGLELMAKTGLTNG
jgi:SPP1 family predicted phage head-tail adaptor